MKRPPAIGLTRQPPGTAYSVLAALGWAPLLLMGWLGQATAAPIPELNALQLRMLDAYALTLRWDNLRGTREWVSGATPRYLARHRLHAVPLAPGQQITFVAPADAVLRLLSLADAPDALDLEVEVSNGSGLFARVQPTRTADGRSLLVRLFESQPSLVRVRRPLPAGSAVEVALFLSRREPLSTLAPFQQPMTAELAEKTVKVRRDDEPTPTSFYRLAAQRPVRLSVQGPTCLQLAIRLPWPETEVATARWFRFHTTLDQAPAQAWEVAVECESRHQVWVDGVKRRLSRQAECLLRVPPGQHSILWQPDMDVYVGFWQLARREYLFPSLNAPRISARSVLESWNFATNKDGGSEWPWDGQEVMAWSLARANSARDAGAQAADVLARSARIHPAYPKAQEIAEKIRRLHTHYRELLPAVKSTRAPLIWETDFPQPIREAGQPPQPWFLSPAIAENATHSLQPRPFLELPNSEARATTYLVPPRSHASQLRITVASDWPQGSQALFLQFDQQPPVRLEWQRPKELAPDRFDSTLVLAALSGLAAKGSSVSNHPPRGSPPSVPGIEEPAHEPSFPTGGHCSVNAQYFRAVTKHCPPTMGFIARERVREDPEATHHATLELDLPQDVESVRLWPAPTNSHSLAVALAYRAAKDFQLDESAYLALLSQADAWAVLSPAVRQCASFLTYAAAPELPEANPHLPQASPAAECLYNDWTALLRLLRLQALEFGKTLDTPQALLAGGVSLNASDIQSLQQQAQACEQTQLWIPALASWNRLARNATSQPEGVWGMARCLAKFNEVFLQEQCLRFLVAHFPNSPVWPDAIQALRQLYQQSGEEDALEMLEAVVAMQCPCATHLARLVERWIDSARYDFALRLGLCLPMADRPRERMLVAAWHQRWWSTYRQLSEALSEPEDRAFWQALQAVAFGQDTAGQQGLQKAGLQGQAMLACLNEWYQVLSNLTSPHQSNYLRVIDQWAAWWSRHPGRKSWQERPDWIQDFAGAAWVYSPARDLYARYARAEPNQPAALRFPGPVRLRLETRLLLTNSTPVSANDWLWVREQDDTQRFPLTGITLNPRLQTVGSPGLTPGTKTCVTLDFGPGWHELQVAAHSHPVLLQAFEQQPELSCGIPPPAAERMTDVLERFLGPPGVRHTELDVVRNPLPLAPASTTGIDFEKKTIAWLDTLWTLPHEGANLDPPLKTRWLNRLLEVAEFAPAFREQAQILGEKMAREGQPPLEAQDALARLTSDRDWRLLPITPLSAGIRFVEVRPDTAESLPQRLRRTMLPPAPAHAVTVGGQSLFDVGLKLLQPKTLSLSLQLVKAGLQPARDMRVACQLDDQTPRQLSLSAEAPQAAWSISLAEGAHQLRVWILDPVVNQFVHCAWTETGNDTAHQDGIAQDRGVPLEKRAYHVATPAEPLQLWINGPTLLRIDEWRDDQTLSQHRALPPGTHLLSLTPPAGQDEALFRVFQRITQTNQIAPRPADGPPILVPPPPTKLTLPPPSPPTPPVLTDYYRLGRQEDGTWSVGLEIARRRPFEIASDHDRVANEYLQSDLSYHRQTPSETIWLRSDALSRWHRQGDWTLGFRQVIMGDPQPSRLNWRWEGEAYAGRITESDSPAEDSWQAALHTAAFVNQRRPISRRSDHTPFAGLFAHYLTLNDQESQSWDYLDQDLYSSYRYEHRWGLVLGDQFTYRPWLDTSWQATFSLTSNEDFLGPDHWGIRFSWLQYLRRVRLEAAYRLAHFLADDDRDDDLFRQSLSLGLSGEHWLNGRHRLEAGLLARQDWPENETSFSARLSWFFDAGRHDRDFPAREWDFRQLRQRDFPDRWNNTADPALDRLPAP